MGTRSLNNTDENIRVVEVLIKCLGTMVMEPQYQTDPNNIGVKTFITTIQKPIFEGEAREILSKKLLETVEQL